MPRSVSQSFLHRTWTSHIKRQVFQKPRGAIEQPTSSEEVILIHLHVSRLRIRVWFRAVGNLAVNLLLGALFVDKSMQGIFIADRKLVPWHSQPPEKTLPGTKTTNSKIVANLTDSWPSSVFIANALFHRVVVAKVATLLPHAHTLVSGRKTVSGMKFIEPMDQSASCAPLHVARVIVDVIANKPFYMLPTNISNEPVHVPMRMNVAQVTDSPAHTVPARAALLESHPETISGLHCKPLVDRDSRTMRHKNVEARGEQNLFARLKEQSPTIAWLCGIPLPVFEHAENVSVHVGIPPQAEEYFDVLRKAIGWENPADTFRTLLGRASGQIIRMTGD